MGRISGIKRLEQYIGYRTVVHTQFRDKTMKGVSEFLTGTAISIELC